MKVDEELISESAFLELRDLFCYFIDYREGVGKYL